MNRVQVQNELKHLQNTSGSVTELCQKCVPFLLSLTKEEFEENRPEIDVLRLIVSAKNRNEEIVSYDNPDYRRLLILGMTSCALE